MKNLVPIIFSLIFPFISLSAQLTALINDSSNISCFESGDGIATVVISGGTEPYEILWNDDSITITASVSNLTADRWYRVTVTDGAIATAMDSVMLSQPDQITYEISGLKTIQCYGPEEGYLKISSAGGTGPHTYAWTGEITSDSDSINGLSAGKYYYLITDSIGCSRNDSLTLEEPDMVKITFDSIFPNPCLGQSVGKIYTSSLGGELPYEYSWTGPSDFTSTLQDITGLGEGMYGLDLTDARGCIYERDTSILDGDPISVTHSVSEYREYNLVCYGDSTGGIKIDTVAGNGLDWKNYKYIWTGPDGYKAYDPEINNLVAGNYFLNVFDSVDCRSDVTISLIHPPQVAIGYDSVVTNPCINDQTSAIYISVLNGIAPFQYSWTGPNGYTSDSKNITNLSKGLYSVSVTDGDGCNSVSNSTLTQVDNITMVLAISKYGDYNINCNGFADGYIKIQSIPGFSDISGFTFYTTGPGGFTSPYRFMTTGVKAGNYHITVTDPEGCLGEQDTLLTEPPRLQTGKISGETSFIQDTNYVYMVENASALSSFAWSVAGGEIWSGQGNESVEIEWRTSYSGNVKVIETDENGCFGDTVYLKTNYKFDPTSTTNILTNSISIYPTPAGNTLHIRGIVDAKGTVEFYSLLGQTVLKTSLAEEINLESLDNGVYYLRIRDMNGKHILSAKIIKK